MTHFGSAAVDTFVLLSGDGHCTLANIRGVPAVPVRACTVPWNDGNSSSEGRGSGNNEDNDGMEVEHR